MRGSRRSGHTLVEALIGLLLLALLLHAAWAALRVHGGAVSSLVAAAGASQAGAAAHGLLRREVRATVAGRDRGAVDADSVSLRSFRGVAIPCPAPRRGGDTMTVAYRGVRSPDPAKDSLLVLGREDGAWRTARLAMRRPAGRRCRGGPDGEFETWEVVGGPEDPVALRVFERGSYHLAEGAFRYRRGRGGRQPLTGEVLDRTASTLEPGPADRIRLRLAFLTGPGRAGVRTWTATVWGRATR